MSFKFNNEFTIPYEKCTKIEGFGNIESSIKKEKQADGVGDVVLGLSINSREMLIEFDVDLEFADSVQRYFKANKQYDLVVDEVRHLNCYVIDCNLINDMSLAVDPTLSLGLYAPDPYFYDVNDFAQNIAGIMPQFGFPWRSTIDDGFSFGYKIFSDRTIFTNNGDIDVGFKVTIEAKGDVSNPKFENLITGKFIQVNIDLVDGDKLEISSVKNKTYIRKNGANVYSNIDRLSDYFYLTMGDNLLKYSSEDGINNMNVYLYYSPAYQNGNIK